MMKEIFTIGLSFYLLALSLAEASLKGEAEKDLPEDAPYTLEERLKEIRLEIPDLDPLPTFVFPEIRPLDMEPMKVMLLRIETPEPPPIPAFVFPEIIDMEPMKVPPSFYCLFPPEPPRIQEKDQKGCEIYDLLGITIEELSEEQMKEIEECVRKVWKKCKDWHDFRKIVSALEDLPSEQRLPILKWMKDSRMVDKCSSWRASVSDLLRALKNLPSEQRLGILIWMKDAGIVEKCQDAGEGVKLIDTFEAFSLEQLQVYLTFLNDLGIWSKGRDGNDINGFLKAIKFFPEEQRLEFLNWLKCIEISNKYQDKKDIRKVIASIKGFPSEQRLGILTLVTASGLYDKCQGRDDILCLLGGIKSLPSEQRLETLAWIKASRVVEKCQDMNDIQDFFHLLDMQFPLIFSHNGYGPLLNPLKVKTYFVDDGFGNDILAWRAKRGDRSAQAILSNEKDLPCFNEHLHLYLFCHAFYVPNDAVEKTLEDKILTEKNPERLLEEIIRILGEEHELSQRCLALALSRDYQNNPKGFLAVHQEMIQKSQEDAQHHLRSLGGIVLNLEKIQEGRPKAPIHMPLNVWDRLFSQFKKTMTQESLAALFGSDVSLESVLALQQEPFLRHMLDPQDSLTTRKDVDSYSHMFRAVLKTVRETDDLMIFGQLLVNILTCQTGKRNGILHSHILINTGQVLDEALLGSEAFKRRSTCYFTEELRRLRETCLKGVVRDVTKKNDPHDDYYVRGVIGHEVGLMFENETPRIDFNAHVVSESLRRMTKQEILDKFYQYYKVEDVIDKVHAMLNNGSVQVTHFDTEQDLTLPILNLYLQEAWEEDRNGFNPDLVVLGAQGTPIGFTPEAAKRLLFKMGFFVHAPYSH